MIVPLTLPFSTTVRFVAPTITGACVICCTPSWKLFVQLFFPPFVVEPLVVMITVTRFVPYEWAVGVKVSVPFVAMLGSTVNRAFAARFVAVTAWNVHVVPAAFPTPGLIAVTKFLFVNAPLSSATSSKFVANVKLGGCVTAWIVNVKLFVVESRFVAIEFNWFVVIEVIAFVNTVTVLSPELAQIKASVPSPFTSATVTK